ncbi:MAG: sensor histidine kinase, partial [Pseudomonadota bacterium]
PNQLLIRDLNRFERLALHEITLTEICVETRLDELTALLLPEGPWRVETLGHADPLITDATLFDEIMSELISNAIKHHSDFDGFIRISIGEAAGSISVEISDNGPGVPSGQLNRIFWPLVKLRSRDEVAGSGLGMSIALRATQKLGGRVEVCAGADTGFALRVVLPKHATGMVAGA